MMRFGMKLLTFTTATSIACIHPLLIRSAQADAVSDSIEQATRGVNFQIVQPSKPSKRIQPSNRQRYDNAAYRAMGAVGSCVSYNDLSACQVFEQNMAALANGCTKDKYACTLYANLSGYEVQLRAVDAAGQSGY